MYYHIFIFDLLLFFILSPGILFQFDSNKSNYIVAFVHALIFGVISTIAFKYYKELYLQEGKKPKPGTVKTTKGKKNCYKKAREGHKKCQKQAESDKNKEAAAKSCKSAHHLARMTCRALI